MLPGTLATVRDPMSGYFAIRRSVIEGCTLKPEGYKILLEVLGRGWYQTVVEVPYIFIERQQGRSKLGLRQYQEFVTHLLCLAWERRELQRFVKYCLVGATGVLMNMGVLAILAGAGMAYFPAGALAVEIAIGTNFLLNEFWSFGDHARRHSGVIPSLISVPQIQLLLCWRSGNIPYHTVALNRVCRLPLSAEQPGWDNYRHSVELWDERQPHMGISACCT